MTTRSTRSALSAKERMTDGDVYVVSRLECDFTLFLAMSDYALISSSSFS